MYNSNPLAQLNPLMEQNGGDIDAGAENHTIQRKKSNPLPKAQLGSMGSFNGLHSHLSAYQKPPGTAPAGASRSSGSRTQPDAAARRAATPAGTSTTPARNSGQHRTMHDMAKARLEKARAVANTSAKTDAVRSTISTSGKMVMDSSAATVNKRSGWKIKNQKIKSEIIKYSK